MLCYVALTFAISWGYYGIYSAIQSHGVALVHFQIVKQFSPAIAAVALIAFTQGTAGLGAVAHRALGMGVGIVWLLLSLVFEPMLFSGIIVSYWISVTDLTGQNLSALATCLYSSVGVFLIGLFRWGLSEEIGWRGWMLPHLQRAYSPLASALIMFIVVTLWHLNPSELRSIAVVREGIHVYGSYPDLVERLIITIPITMLMNFIFNRTGGSLLAMMVFHSASNTSYFALLGAFPEVNSSFFKAGFLAMLMLMTPVLAYLLFKRGKSVAGRD